MKHIAAYLLLTLGGKESPSAADIKALLDTVGIEADDERLEKLISELNGKDIAQVRSATRLPWLQPDLLSFAAPLTIVLTSSPLFIAISYSSSLRALRSSPPSPRAVLLPLPLLVVPPPLVVLPPRRLRRRRRRRRRSP